MRCVDDGSRIVRLGTDPRWVGVCPQCGEKSARSKGRVTTPPRDAQVGPDLEGQPVHARRDIDRARDVGVDYAMTHDDSALLAQLDALKAPTVRTCSPN
ncbi:hypothetical protein Rruber_04968 [Rhodococcus ruber]|nr:transposase [Rhodococcus ruber]